MFFLFRHNTEKVIYFLLLDRKLRNPSSDDPEEIRSRSSTRESHAYDISCIFFGMLTILSIHSPISACDRDG
ncbi:uncharacterized protein DEA37_0007599 [Paragonimus westermani]|uniref:non-specific serine/threonine protein kinase n=1 Tax=Paragonimus westermani TaxID=34504 RepID=A0A5J4NUK8_9TREM|nr:uncharacterized protein DEA37_0007599 [Paragonimus westermani]